MRLADHLGRDAFPALVDLRFLENPSITDVGVVALKAPQTFLTDLELCDVGLTDVGMTVVSSLLYQGCFEQLQLLNLSGNRGMTNQGIVALARAIETRGLPLLKEFSLFKSTNDQVTLLWISAIAQAVIKGCPNFTLCIYSDVLSSR